MMTLDTVDPMMRGASIALLLLWSLLLRDHWRALAAKIALLLNFAIICHVLAWNNNPLANLTVARAALDVASCSVIGLIWLFTRVWFDDLKKVNMPSMLAVAFPPTVVLASYIFGLYKLEWFLPAWFPILRFIWFAFIISALWIAWRGRDDDLVEARRRLRLQIVGVMGVLSLAINLVEIAVFRFHAPYWWRLIPEAGIVFATLIISASMFQHRQADQFGPVLRESGNGATPDAEDDPAVQRLLAHMTAQLPHREETLTIAGLAAQLGEQEYRLRRLINGKLGFRNFNQFLNGYRLAEVKAALADTSQREVPILTMALDAGFGSLGPFNRAFRDAEGMTPSEYRRRVG